MARRGSKEKHGMHKSITYSSWAQMKSRCNNPKNPAYADYGGRGIRVCEQWSTFSGFFKDMGERPGKEYCIERIDNDKGYEPGNCTWATRKEQVRNRRTTRTLTIRGVTKPLGQWCEEYGIHHRTLSNRVAAGWTEEQLLTPTQNRGLHAKL